MSATSSDYASVVASLLPPACNHHVLSLPVSPRKPTIPSNRISSLSVHPVVESALHILNMDLPSAHFLLRHMQADPAWEAMYLHGILHRIEGDLDNARAWYGDVKDSEVFRSVWQGMNSKGAGASEETNGNDEKIPGDQALTAARSFIDRVEAYKETLVSTHAKSKIPHTEDQAPTDNESLTDVSVRELRHVLSFCERKYGISAVADASKVWVSMNEKHADKAAEMITGGEGWRQF